MNEKYEKLNTLLKELFQLDQPDLDFGLYRIMHAKSTEVTQFLDKDLLPQVKQAFELYRPADKVELEKELAKAIEQANSLGADPETLPKVKDLRKKLADEAVDISGLESEVYDRLFTFFRRYYSEGDFLAKRVYKPGVYAIPYEGEEVKLYWANDDQYYIKTSEYLRDYAFRLRPEDSRDPMRVHFRLGDAAEEEHGNVKPANGKDRVFLLAAGGKSGHDFITEERGELYIRFEYRSARLDDWFGEAREGKTKPPTQKDLIAIAIGRLFAVADPSLLPWISQLAKLHMTPNGDSAEYSRVEAHLRRYTARNTFDYFIHKDLGGFLRRELDFYIKNEIMYLDDVENESAPRAQQSLSKIKVIRRIAGKMIDFLAQLEDFQKKLWLKRKFVIETNYCIRLNRIPAEFYPEIAANEPQRQEWVQLLGIDQIKGDLTTPAYSEPISLDFLAAHPTLVVDSRNFADEFTGRLLEAIGDLEEESDGLLIHSENFQGLLALGRSHKSEVEVVYIDPPYNTDASAILYKNDYKDSSWLTLIDNRTALAADLMSPGGVICFAIDDEEVAVGRQLLRHRFIKELGVAVVRSNPQSRKAKGKFSPVHEYALFYGKSADSTPGSLELTEKRLARYPKEDDKGRYAWMNLIRTGSNDQRADRPKLFYPIFVDDKDNLRVPDMTWSEEAREYIIRETPKDNESVVLPVVETEAGKIEKNWHRGHPRIATEPEEYRVRREGKSISIDFKTRMDEDSMPSTWWEKNEYASANYGAAELKELFGDKPFDFPKALSLVIDCLKAANAQQNSVILDYFAGSGTTGHAVINLNREDGGRRKFVLVEVGNYFETVLLPRIKKVTFAPQWNDGKPQRSATQEQAERSPRVIKVIRLESYEDALNNLETRRTLTQQKLLEGAATQEVDSFRERYMLRYMLDVETRGSQSLLNIQAFQDPTAYKMKVKRLGSDESCEVNIDLLETFNCLTGLKVKHIAAPQCFNAEFRRDSEKRLQLKGRIKQDPAGPWWFRTVIGTTPDGRRTLIIWRKLTGNSEQDNLVLDEWFTKQRYSTKDYEFQLIYVNADNNLENLKAPDETWKVRLIEEDFHRLMFDMEGV